MKIRFLSFHLRAENGASGPKWCSSLLDNTFMFSLFPFRNFTFSFGFLSPVNSLTFFSFLIVNPLNRLSYVVKFTDLSTTFQFHCPCLNWDDLCECDPLVLKCYALKTWLCYKPLFVFVSLSCWNLNKNICELCVVWSVTTASAWKSLVQRLTAVLHLLVITDFGKFFLMRLFVDKLAGADLRK